MNRALWVIAAILFVLIIGTAIHSPICPEEDSPACVWVGPLQGNHRGDIVMNP